MAQPLQLIVTGESEDNHFVLREDNLATIVGKIPQNTKVAIVSVVGAFRTGKSFLLNFFLRYLRNTNHDDLTQAWMVSEGDELTEGNMNEGWNLVESSVSNKENSFAWRGGQERQTTGIWMWSEPFIRSSKSSGEKIAVLLMDTQGMFDNETTMTLTAQIFGLSTLVSSFQIYNVDKRIQEDNLQHLALFSEYGRMALQPKKEAAAASVASESAAGEASGKSQAEQSGEASETSSEEESTKDESAASAAAAQPSASSDFRPPPFQRLQFLVRDWQNFDTDFEEGSSSSETQYTALCGEMSAYLAEVLRMRNQSDLQSTREQITRCFGKLDCYMLPHPGFAVTKKNYDGSISKIEPFFRSLVNRYVRYIFDDELEAKAINGRLITGKELQTYFEVYVRMFQAGEKSFPKAMTMLDATAEANNRNASDLGLAFYKEHMERLAGNERPFVKEAELTAQQETLAGKALAIFDEIATMGDLGAIARARETLSETIRAEGARYQATNALRNPFKDVEMYAMPLAIAAVAWILAVLVNATCSTDFCEKTEDTFVNVYLFILFGIFVLTYKHIRGAVGYLKEVLPVVLNQGGGGSAGR